MNNQTNQTKYIFDVSDPKSLGPAIFFMRSRMRKSRSKLAKEAGVGTRFIYDLERGKETVQLNKIIDVLKIFGGKISISCVKD